MSCNVAMLQTFFTQRALKGHFKGTLKSPQGHLGTRALRDSRHLSTWLVTRALEALKGHLGTRALIASAHLGNWSLEGHLGTQVFGHSRFLRHFIYHTRSNRRLIVIQITKSIT